jgi:hypothetical protein
MTGPGVKQPVARMSEREIRGRVGFVAGFRAAHPGYRVLFDE